MARRVGPVPRPRPTQVDPATAGRDDPAIARLARGSAKSRRLVSDGIRRDLPRLAVAGLSAVVPGLGQLLNGRRRVAAALIIPTLVVVAVVLAVVLRTPRMRLVASLVVPSTLDTLLALNLVLFGWRLLAVGQAFVDRRPRAMPSRWGMAGLVALGLLVAAPHAAANYYGSIARQSFAQFFAPTTPAAAVSGSGAGPSQAAAPGPNDRLDVLLIAFDKTTERTATLTDSLIVASIDPVLGTASMVSVPRDMVGVPLGDGRTYGPKLNSLYSYAGRHPSEFGGGPIRAVEDAVGALLGIRIDYYVTTDFQGFVKMIDAIGGVDVVVEHGFTDPMYDGWDGTTGRWGTGWSITAGPHHLDGLNALAYARSRYAPGESDFKRAARQQQILVALKQKLMSGGNLLFRLPQLLRTIGDTVRTDLPPERLPDLAAMVESTDGATMLHTVIQHPFVRGTTRAPYGSVQIPDLAAIRELAAHLFPAPGVEPTLWSPAGASTPPSAAP